MNLQAQLYLCSSGGSWVILQTQGVGHCDNRAMRQPGKTSSNVLSLNTDYVASTSTLRRKGKLRSSTYTVCVETTEKSPKPQGKIELSNAFCLSKFLHRTSEVRWKPPLKITFSILCSKTCRCSNGSFWEIDDGNWVKYVFSGNFHHWSLCTVAPPNS